MRLRFDTAVGIATLTIIVLAASTSSVVQENGAAQVKSVIHQQGASSFFTAANEPWWMKPSDGLETGAVLESPALTQTVSIDLPRRLPRRQMLPLFSAQWDEQFFPHQRW
jgi:hypothetical protein